MGTEELSMGGELNDFSRGRNAIPQCSLPVMAGTGSRQVLYCIWACRVCFDSLVAHAETLTCVVW
jgi:hypothetical protein